MRKVKVLKDIHLHINVHPAKDGDIGRDIKAFEDVLIPSFAFRKIKSGARIQLPSGIYARLIGRSSLANNGILTFHGLIDSGYTGTLDVILFNLTYESYTVRKGDRIGQLVFFYHVDDIELEEVDMFEDTERGSTGFGSSGI